MKNISKNTIKTAIIALGLGLLLGGWLFGGSAEAETEQGTHTHEEGTLWTCSMHPQIRQKEPGDCPLCGMDLIPMTDDMGEEENPMAIRMSPTAMQLANVQTAVVGEGKGVKNVLLNGKVQADERLRFTQSSHIAGRVERLMVDFTGAYVSEGQTLAYIYSPELVVAQEELFEAAKIKDVQPALFEATKQQLKNWKLSDKAIEGILASGKAQEQFPILANVSGYVSQKKVNLGDYIKQGQPIYEISDLSKVWILFDVYESDMAWVKKGDKVEYTIPSLEEERFTGRISYLDPTIDPQTRVASARIEVANKGLRLKPEMFVRGKVEANIQGRQEPISVPKTAVMWTGKRSVVYVKNTSDQGVEFTMREVVLGPALGDAFLVESGLRGGEELAVNGTFSIDAAAQLSGKYSMMNPMPESERQDVVVIGQEAKKELLPLFNSYFDIKNALANDDAAKALAATKQFAKVLAGINHQPFKGATHEIWMKQFEALKPIAEKATALDEIAQQRENFIPLSSAVIALAKAFSPLEETIYQQHCPMADSNKGADWLSKEKEVANPYFGASMLKCGEVVEVIVP